MKLTGFPPRACIRQTLPPCQRPINSLMATAPAAASLGLAAWNFLDADWTVHVLRLGQPRSDCRRGNGTRGSRTRLAPLPIAASRTRLLGGTVATVGFPDIGLQGVAQGACARPPWGKSRCCPARGMTRGIFKSACRCSRTIRATIPLFARNPASGMPARMSWPVPRLSGESSTTKVFRRRVLIFCDARMTAPQPALQPLMQWS